MSKLKAIINKISEIGDLLKKANDWKFQNQKIVFTNGVFDILHRGHIEYLAQAADFGDVLIVGINSDNSVKRLGKGDSRPLQDENSRALIIGGLTFVDAVVIFENDTPLNLITKLIPDVLVKGGDYDAKSIDVSDKKYIVGSDVVKNNGGEVEVIPFVEGYSTSKIEEKIKRG
ncbi:MAG: D-glycero-beta-D-manno-heptose 1-phosphate adenylyltransferase [Flavobacteriales bacterium]|nr:MAG: D-glycero-beta-D-manno-heptose 1-phosphate adenylyltransferase [Flavobacteriales bacterium]